MNEKIFDKRLKDIQIVLNKYEDALIEQQRDKEDSKHGTNELEKVLNTFENMTIEKYNDLYDKAGKKMGNNLIYDLGFHRGEDTRHYLSKGFKVIAVEANPFLVEQAKIDFKDKIEKGDLVLLNTAIGNPDSTGKMVIEFYVNHEHTDWSSATKEYAEQQNSTSKKIIVGVITIKELIYKFGVPYFIKVDVEGNDTLVVEQIYKLKEEGFLKSLPQYISLELNKKDYKYMFAYLLLCGYKEFQIINQINNEPFCSGEFGEYLDQTKWIDYDTALERYMDYRRLKIIDNKNLSLGWVDIVAKL